MIIVKEAQEMKTLKDLSDYAKRPGTTYHFNFGAQTQNIRQTTGPCQSIVGSASVRIQKMYDNQLPAWILGYARSIN